MKKAICAKCHNFREVFLIATINGVELKFCKPCQLKQRAEFVELLESGDPKARTLYAAVSQAFSKGDKVQ